MSLVTNVITLLAAPFSACGCHWEDKLPVGPALSWPGSTSCGVTSS